MSLRYLSVFSGIEAATVAWHPLGWAPVAFAEIEKFPAAVLAAHYPRVPNRGDVTQFKSWPDESIDLLVGGTPCQAFSIAGLRKGLADPRGNLALTYLAVAQRYRPRWVVWENVPGVHSSWSDVASHAATEESLRAITEARRAVESAGVEFGADFGAGDFEECDQANDFDCFVAGLEELGYGVATRVLDAQFFGVAQRRRRVFVVGYLGDWRRAGAVLFEPESLRGDSAPSREARERTAGTLTRSALDGSSPCGGDGRDGLMVAAIAPTLNAHFGEKQGLENQHIDGGGGCLLPAVGHALTTKNQRNDFETETLIPTRRGGFFDGPTHALKGEGHDASEDGTGRGVPLLPIGIDGGDLAFALRAGASHSGDKGDGGMNTTLAIAFSAKDCGADAGELAPTLRAGGHTGSHANGGVMPAVAIREVASPLTTCYGKSIDHAGSKGSGPDNAIIGRFGVRRLTPMECERLQGFPDDYTRILYRGKLAADGPRYKALGNSMAVPCMAWIGRRIALADALSRKDAAA